MQEGRFTLKGRWYEEGYEEEEEEGWVWGLVK